MILSQFVQSHEVIVRSFMLLSVFTIACVLVVCLLTDSRCEASGNLLDLLKVLNTCLLMADEIGLSQGASSLLLPFIAIRFTYMKRIDLSLQMGSLRVSHYLNEIIL